FPSSTPLFTHSPSNRREPQTAVRNETNIEMINSVANPLTELVPKTNNTIAAINVVTLASRIAENELAAPALNDSLTERPMRSSSRIRSYVMMLASTAIPTPSMIAAIPGSVRTPPIHSNTRRIKYTYADNVTTATIPG